MSADPYASGPVLRNGENQIVCESVRDGVPLGGRAANNSQPRIRARPEVMFAIFKNGRCGIAWEPMCGVEGSERPASKARQAANCLPDPQTSCAVFSQDPNAVFEAFLRGVNTKYTAGEATQAAVETSYPNRSRTILVQRRYGAAWNAFPRREAPNSVTIQARYSGLRTEPDTISVHAD